MDDQGELPTNSTSHAGINVKSQPNILPLTVDNESQCRRSSRQRKLNPKYFNSTWDSK